MADWKTRLRDLLLAGGSIAMIGCSSTGPHIPACNANPDPCCADPTGPACAAFNSCQSAGGFLQYEADGGTSCIVLDAGTDGAR